MNHAPYLNYNIRLAATWHIISELFRRHHNRYGLRVFETHPGGGQYDCLSVYGSSSKKITEHYCDFNIQSQHLHILSGVEHDSDVFERIRWPYDNDYVLALLVADDPKKTVDDLESLLGFPKIKQLPSTTPPVLCARVIAAFLARYSFSREKYQTRSLWHDSSGMAGSSIRFDLIDNLTELRQKLEALDETQASSWLTAARFMWVGKEGSKDGIVFDFAKGIVYFTHKKDLVLSLANCYKHERRVNACLWEIEQYQMK